MCLHHPHFDEIFKDKKGNHYSVKKKLLYRGVEILKYSGKIVDRMDTYLPMPMDTTKMV
jgi:hypothetical protein